MTGRTERNLLSLHGRGGLACISPWSFPLAIFLGQVSVAPVAGNGVIADPGDLATDVGPVIDAEAQRRLEDHARGMEREGRLVYRLPGIKSARPPRGATLGRFHVQAL